MDCVQATISGVERKFVVRRSGVNRTDPSCWCSEHSRNRDTSASRKPIDALHRIADQE